MSFVNGLRGLTQSGTHPLVQSVAFGTAFASAITGGVMFAFSAFVVPGLRRLPVPQAVAAMQSINVQAPRSALMVPLVGSAVGSAAVVVVALVRGATDQRPMLLIGGALGIASFAITAGYHVPRNDALGTLDPHAPETLAAWRDYAAGWTAWNHVRAAAALGSAVALVAGAVRGS